MVRSDRLAGAALGLLVDRAVGEPPAALHPVAAFGTVMTALEDEWWADRRGRGVVHAAAGVGLGVAAGTVVGSTTAGVASAAAGRMLRDSALAIGADLRRGDLDGARAALPTLVGRDPSGLDASGVAAAVVESVAENTVDAVVAPALWGAALGARGAFAHRALNTLDAMVGHHTTRYERFGWASARADDVAAWVPARVTALLVLAVAPRARAGIVRAVRDDAPRHPSPNAGVAEAAFAGALGVELGGPLRYGDREERRPTLGTGPRPGPGDIERAVRLENALEGLLCAALVGAAALVRWRRGRR